MIPNGCDLEIFKPSLRDNLLLEGVKPTDKVVIFTGAHGVANGLDAYFRCKCCFKGYGKR